MARETRRQRRARARRRAGDGSARPARRGATPRRSGRAQARPVKQQTGPQGREASAAQLRPRVVGRAQEGRLADAATRSFQGDVVVIIACAIVGAYLWGLDLVFQPVVERVLLSREQPMFRWYVINTYSGHENKVKTNLEHRIVSMNQQPALPPRRRPDRAGDRDEGRPEGADREARAPRLRAREHGHVTTRPGRS